MVLEEILLSELFRKIPYWELLYSILPVSVLLSLLTVNPRRLPLARLLEKTFRTLWLRLNPSPELPVALLRVRLLSSERAVRLNALLVSLSATLRTRLLFALPTSVKPSWVLRLALLEVRLFRCATLR